jgi:radical SAM protein with 4Fe4S-binding SPASM domain
MKTNKAKDDISPRVIAFEVTRRCKFNCPQCRAAATKNNPDGELTTEQCKKILKSIAAFSKCMIIITGGEPLERKDIYEIISCGKELGLTMVMATCGYMIDEDSIIKLKKAGIKTLSLSLDGANAETNDKLKQTQGAFDSVIKAAKLAKDAKMKFQINTTISKLNIDEAVGIADLAKRLGASCFNPFILVPTGRGKNISDQIIDPIEYETLVHELLRLKVEADIEVRLTCGPQFARVCRQEKLKKITSEVNGCIGGKAFGFVSYKGDIQVCGFLDKSAGNLVENNFNFKKIWQQSEFLKNIRDLSNLKGTCGMCEFSAVCSGCRARSYALSGNFMGSDPVCSYQPGPAK